MLQIGVVISEATVENTTTLVANTASPSYLEAKMLVVAPAGIAVSNTQAPVTMGAIFKRRHGMNTMTGISTSLKTVK